MQLATIFDVLEVSDSLKLEIESTESVNALISIFESVSQKKVFMNAKWFSPADPHFTSTWIVALMERTL